MSLSFPVLLIWNVAKILLKHSSIYIDWAVFENFCHLFTLTRKYFRILYFLLNWHLWIYYRSGDMAIITLLISFNRNYSVIYIQKRKKSKIDLIDIGKAIFLKFKAHYQWQWIMAFCEVRKVVDSKKCIAQVA